MSQIYKCDHCDKEFGGPLDTEKYNDKLYDLCFPCRDLLAKQIEQIKDSFFNIEKII